MSDYTQSTFFAPKDLLATGNPNKIIYGSDVDAELSAISTAIATKADVNGDAIGAGTPCTELSVDNLKLDGNKIISTNTDGDIEMEPDGTGIVTISSDVGIGTASPATALDVVGTVTADGLTVDGTAAISGAATAGFVTPLLAKNPSTNAASSVKIGLDAGGITWGEIGASYNTNDPYMAFFVRSGSEKVRITDAGNVGIGDSNPSYRLVVKTSSGPYVTEFYNNNSSTNEYNVSLWGQAASGSATGYVGTGGSAVANSSFANNFVVGTQSNNPLVFNTNDTERMRLDASGNFLVGTTSNAGYGGHVIAKDGTDSNTVAIINSATSNPYGPNITFSGASPNDTTRYFLYCTDSTTARAVIRSNGGLVNYQSNNVDLSDIRTKKDITPAPSYWDKIGALEIVTYKYKDQSHDDVNVGVIAQQVETVEPVWVDNDGFGNSPEGEEPLKTVYTKDITFAAIKALQEAMARIETLEAEVAALKGE